MTENWRIQFSDTIKGTLVNFRAESPEELLGLFDSEDLARAVEKFVDLKQVIVAKNVRTADERYNSSAPKADSASAEKPKAAGNGVKLINGVPHCTHGEMNDLSDRGYKNTHYCAEKDRSKQCKFSYNARA